MNMHSSLSRHINASRASTSRKSAHGITSKRRYCTPVAAVHAFSTRCIIATSGPTAGFMSDPTISISDSD